MKKLLAISLIVAGTFASVGIASANSIISESNSGWVSDAYASGDN